MPTVRTLEKAIGWSEDVRGNSNFVETDEAIRAFAKKWGPFERDQQLKQTMLDDDIKALFENYIVPLYPDAPGKRRQCLVKASPSNQDYPRDLYSSDPGDRSRLFRGFAEVAKARSMDYYRGEGQHIEYHGTTEQRATCEQTRREFKERSNTEAADSEYVNIGGVSEGETPCRRQTDNPRDAARKARAAIKKAADAATRPSEWVISDDELINMDDMSDA